MRNKRISSDATYNFVHELPYVINSAIFENASIVSRVENFYNFYKQYMQSRRLDFYVVVLLKYYNWLYVFNSLPQQIVIKSISGNLDFEYRLDSNGNVKLPFADVRVMVGNRSYDYHFNNEIDVKYLLVTEKQD